MLIALGNLASTYKKIGRYKEALRIQRDVYFRNLKINSEEDANTLREALNYALILALLQRFEEARSLLRKTMPVAQRVLGESNELTLRMTINYAMTLYRDTGTTLEDLREAVKTLEDAERIARRVLGGAHPVTTGIETILHNAQAKLRACEASPGTG